jgi:hypothetical protein
MPKRDETADRKLLLTIIQLGGVNLPAWSTVVAEMGEGYTTEAVRLVKNFSVVRSKVDWHSRGDSVVAESLFNQTW